MSNKPTAGAEQAQVQRTVALLRQARFGGPLHEAGSREEDQRDTAAHRGAGEVAPR